MVQLLWLLDAATPAAALSQTWQKFQLARVSAGNQPLDWLGRDRDIHSACRNECVKAEGRCNGSVRPSCRLWVQRWVCHWLRPRCTGAAPGAERRMSTALAAGRAAPQALQHRRWAPALAAARSTSSGSPLRCSGQYSSAGLISSLRVPIRGANLSPPVGAPPLHTRRTPHARAPAVALDRGGARARARSRARRPPGRRSSSSSFSSPPILYGRAPASDRTRGR